MYLTCITIAQSTIITSLTGFNIGLTNVDARLKQRCTNVVQRYFDVVSTLGNDVVSTLCNVENHNSIPLKKGVTTSACFKETHHP